MAKENDLLKFDSGEEFYKAQAEYWDKHPEVPKAKPIECLNLIMRKQFAEAILKGEKKVEFRAWTDHYVSRLIDKDCDNYKTLHYDDIEVRSFVNTVRPVEKIHFHNYNNTWYLDVECTNNYVMPLVRHEVEALHNIWGCHEMDDMLADFERRGDDIRPIFFLFACGDVIDTNLK